ncbi:MAG: acetyl-CoA carboxylase biotin carboxylase subunit [Coriobacteriia bacterium]|nr:acetyl-CoA carboxylase biotin carboxylase subunit [Coriobacteriia bacterium]
MFKRILVANRGEIALRVVRACHDLGVEAYVAYSEADKDTRAVQLADKAVLIGPAPSAKSYLSMPALIGAAQAFECEAIHPGYGFLSENADFARACAENDIVFIGPDPDLIDKMGEKSNAKQTMKKAGVPTVPGSDGPLESAEQARELAAEFGYPVLIKASAGGGGKGMRLVEKEADMEHQYQAAKSEAKIAFGNDEVYLEKYLIHPRHIEIQVLADKHGNAIHLCERDCSVQRRHQKLIEEAPSPALDEALRQEMGAAAVRAVKEVGYTNAGTIEFLLDAEKHFYFMEMNTRIQVEHPVTEFITLEDLVLEQIRIAAGEPLDFGLDKEISPIGHAFEFRINAEDPDHSFRPNPGKITKLILPGGPGVRVDTHIYEGYKVPPTYDSLIAKLIVWGKDREQALARSKRALSEFVIEGIKTTIPFHLAALEEKAFKNGMVYTDFIETYMSEYLA